MKLPPKLQAAGSTVSIESGGGGLALEVCRPNNAVLQSWDEKVFPGEGVVSESARGTTFTGKCVLAKIFYFSSLPLVLACCWLSVCLAGTG